MELSEVLLVATSGSTLWSSETIKKVQGVVHGKTITFGEDLGFVDGQQVEVTVEEWKPDDASWGEGLRRCAGAWAGSGTEEEDRILQQIYQSEFRAIYLHCLGCR